MVIDMEEGIIQKEDSDLVQAPIEVNTMAGVDIQQKHFHQEVVIQQFQQPPAEIDNDIHIPAYAKTLSTKTRWKKRC